MVDRDNSFKLLFLSLIIVLFFGGAWVFSDGTYSIPFSTGIDVAEKALCFIITGNGTASCTVVDDTFTFFAGPGMIIENNGKTINFSSSAPGGGEANTASNVGTGSGVFQGKSGIDLQFHTLLAGANITITDLGDELQINATGGSGGGGVTDIHNLVNVTSVGCADGQILETSGGVFLCIDTPGSISNIHDIANVTSVGCATNEILKVSGSSWVCSSDNSGSGGGGGGAAHNPYDYFIYTNSTGYYAYNNTNSLISNNADFDTVFTALKADDVYSNANQVFIQLGSGEFLTDAGITINRDNVTLAGQNSATWLGLDTGTPEGTELLTIGTTVTSTTYNIGDENQGALTLTTDTAADAGNFATDDYILVQSDTIVGIGADSLRAQFAKVKNAYSGNGTIQLRGDLWEDYITVGGASPTVRLADTLIENVVLKDFGVTDLRTSVTSVHQGYISTWFVKNLSIENVIIEDVYYVAMGIRGTIDTKISDCNIENVKKIVNNDIIHYGISVSGLNQGVIVSGCTIEHVRHGILSTEGSRASGTSGAMTNFVIDGNSVVGASSSCYDTHSGVKDVTISNNSCEGRSNNITNDPAEAESSGITARSSAVIIGNTIKNVENRCVYLYEDFEGTALSIPPDDSIISNNKCLNVGVDGFKIENATHTIISDNVIIGTGADGIRVENGDGTYDQFVLITNNIIKDTTDDGIDSLSRINAIGNYIENAGDKGIYLFGSTAWSYNPSGSVLKDNHVLLAGDQGIRMDAARFLTVDGNIIDKPGSNCFYALANANYDLSNSTLTNNICISPDYPVSGGNPSRFLFSSGIIGSYIANNQAINATSNNAAIYSFAGATADNFFIDNTITGDTGVDPLDFSASGGGTDYCLGNFYTENGATFFDNNDGTCPT